MTVIADAGTAGAHPSMQMPLLLPNRLLLPHRSFTIVNASVKCVSNFPFPVGFQHGRSRTGTQMPSLQQETQE
jgi:hypothetical protein